MKYYNFETMWRSLKDLLCKYLKENSIYYELSGAAAGWHIEILTDPTGAQMINNYINSIIITEVTQ
jgi:hypothetical protein